MPAAFPVGQRGDRQETCFLPCLYVYIFLGPKNMCFVVGLANGMHQNLPRVSHFAVGPLPPRTKLEAKSLTLEGLSLSTNHFMFSKIESCSQEIQSKVYNPLPQKSCFEVILCFCVPKKEEEADAVLKAAISDLSKLR